MEGAPKVFSVRNWGFFLDGFRFYGHMNIKENLNFFYGIRGETSRALKWAEFVGFAQKFDVGLPEGVIDTLPEIIKQKLLMLLAIYDSPEILIMQDPFMVQRGIDH